MSEVILIGGCSGVGKSSAAFALHDLLSEKDLRHAVVEGDALDLAHPAPWKHRLAERNLAAIWANYRELGYERLVYTNTVSALEADRLTDAMGDAPSVTSVLLRASSQTITGRLGQREDGQSFDDHLERSNKMARHLDRAAPDTCYRLDTDGLNPQAVASHILAISGWSDIGP